MTFYTPIKCDLSVIHLLPAIHPSIHPHPMSGHQSKSVFSDSPSWLLLSPDWSAHLAAAIQDLIIISTLTSCMPQMKAKVHLPLQHPIVSCSSSSPVIHVEKKKTVKLPNLQQNLENPPPKNPPGGPSGSPGRGAPCLAGKQPGNVVPWISNTQGGRGQGLRMDGGPWEMIQVHRLFLMYPQRLAL